MVKPANHCVCPFSYSPGLIRQEVYLAGYCLAVYSKHRALFWGEEVYIGPGCMGSDEKWTYGVTEEKYNYIGYYVAIKFYLMHSLLSICVLISQD